MGLVLRYLYNLKIVILNISLLGFSLLALPLHIQAQVISPVPAIVAIGSNWALSSILFQRMSSAERSNVSFVISDLARQRTIATLAPQWKTSRQVILALPRIEPGKYVLTVKNGSSPLLIQSLIFVSRNEANQIHVALKGKSFSIPPTEISPANLNLLSAKLGGRKIQLFGNSSEGIKLDIAASSISSKQTLSIYAKVSSFTFLAQSLKLIIQNSNLPSVRTELNANSIRLSTFESQSGVRIEPLVRRKRGIPTDTIGFQLTTTNGESVTIPIQSLVSSNEAVGTSSTSSERGVYWAKMNLMCGRMPVAPTDEMKGKFNLNVGNTFFPSVSFEASKMSTGFAAPVALPEVDPRAVMGLKASCEASLYAFDQICKLSNFLDVAKIIKKCIPAIPSGAPGGSALLSCLNEIGDQAGKEIARSFVSNICKTDAINAATNEREKQDLLARCDLLVGESTAICNLPKILGQENSNVCEAFGYMYTAPITHFELSGTMRQGWLPPKFYSADTKGFIVETGGGIRPQFGSRKIEPGSIIDLGNIELDSETCQGLPTPAPTSTPLPTPIITTIPTPQPTQTVTPVPTQSPNSPNFEFQIMHNVVGGARACISLIRSGISEVETCQNVEPAIITRVRPSHPEYSGQGIWKIRLTPNSSQGLYERTPAAQINLVFGEYNNSLGSFEMTTGRDMVCEHSDGAYPRPCYLD